MMMKMKKKKIDDDNDNDTIYNGFEGKVCSDWLRLSVGYITW